MDTGAPFEIVALGKPFGIVAPSRPFEIMALGKPFGIVAPSRPLVG